MPGHITDCGYHGHDAVLRVRAEGDPGLPVLTVRTMGGPPLATGARVILRARGPVLTWPR